MSDINNFNFKKCLICNKGKKNDVLHFHKDPDSGDIWLWCCKCARGYTIYEYCNLAGLSLKEFLKNDFDFQESKPNEVNKLDFSRNFVPLFDPRAKPGIEYLKSRGIDEDDGMYYDIERKGIVFPYYYGDIYCGAQIRFLEEWADEDGEIRKVDTIPGTRLGLLFYSWNQSKFINDIKGIIITEGAFNAIAIRQALDKIYGGVAHNPWKCIACSGSGATQHQLEAIKELKDAGFKTIIAPDNDQAGIKMFKKFIDFGAISHYAIPPDQNIDWNDIAKTLGKSEFAEWFLKEIKSVKKM